MRKITVILVMLAFISGCSASAQKGAIGFAYSNYQKGDYEDVLTITERAQSYKEPSHEVKAEILFLRALALEKLERHNEAQEIFKLLADKFNDTEYGYRAIEILK